MQQLQLVIHKLCVRLAALRPKGGTSDGAKRARTLLVTSPRRGEGKTVVASAVAVHLSKLGQGRVLLVDANFEYPGVHYRMKIPMGPGFYGALSTGAVDDGRIFHSEVSQLDILSAGEKCDPSILFNNERIRAFLDQMSPRYDWIVFDGASILDSGGNGLVQVVDGVIIVVDSRSTRRQIAKDAIDGLAIEREKILGVVLNRRRYEIPSLLYRWV